MPKTQQDIIRDDLLNNHDDEGTLHIEIEMEIIAITTQLKTTRTEKKKRKAALHKDDDNNNGSNNKNNVVGQKTKTTRTSTKVEMEKEMDNYMQRRMELHIPVVSSSYSTSSSSIDAAGCGGNDTNSIHVYASCKEVCGKISHFVLKRERVTKSVFCRCIGNVNHNSFNRFLMTEYSGQHGCGMKVYQLAYTFFERMRMMEQQSKTPERLQNESKYHLHGFSLQSLSMGRPSTTYGPCNPLFLRDDLY